MSNLHPIFQNIVELFQLPKCGECGAIFSAQEVADRKSWGLDVFDKDTICDICDAIHEAEIANHNFEVKHE